MTLTISMGHGVRAESATVPDLRRTGIHPGKWYPLARAKKLGRGKTLGVSFAGEPIVLVRTKSDRVFALEDRCAHRQVPLHAGRVNGECVQCCYHGWTYDSTGHCINVPYLDRTKSLPNGVRSYPCREAFGLIFVFTGDPADLETAIFPNIPSFGDSAYKTRFLDRHVRAHFSFMHENLMDMNHQFLHRRLMGRIRTTLLDLRRGHDWVEADYTFSRVSGRQPIGEKFILGARPKATAARAHDLMTIATNYPYQSLRFWTAGSEHPALDLWNAYVPTDTTQSANHTLGLMMIRKPALPGLIDILWPFIVWFTEGIFAEDRWIVEAEQRAFESQGADRNQEIFPVILALRKLLIDKGVSLDAAAPVRPPLRSAVP